MPSMPPMHEHVKQRASKNDKPRQPAQKMGTMFRDQVESADRQEAIERNVGGAKAARSLLLIVHAIGVRFRDWLALILILRIIVSAWSKHHRCETVRKECCSSRANVMPQQR